MGLYESNDWKSLDPVDRAQLLLVIEGLKTGCIIGTNWTSALRIFQQTGLEYRLNTPPGRLSPVMRVARAAAFEELTTKIMGIPPNASRQTVHTVYENAFGEFLGYPLCCVEEYWRKRTKEEKKALRQGKKELSYRFGRELKEVIQRARTYPEVLDYRPLSFTPCSIECSAALALLGQWKTALDHLDPEAATEIVYFNRSEKPESEIHKEYLSERARQNRLEAFIDSFQDSEQQLARIERQLRRRFHVSSPDPALLIQSFYRR